MQSGESKEMAEYMVLGWLQGVESLLATYQLQRVAWLIWNSEENVRRAVQEQVDVRADEWTEEGAKFYSHALEYVVEAVGEVSCLHGMLMSSKANTVLQRGPKAPVLDYLLLPYAMYNMERPPKEKASAEYLGSNIRQEELDAMDEAGIESVLMYLAGQEQGEEEFKERLMQRTSLALYACLSAHSQPDMTVERLEADVLEPFCLYTGHPRDRAALVLALWRTDCTHRELKKGLDMALLEPSVGIRRDPQLYRRVLWTLTRQGHFHMVCNLLEVLPPPGFNVFDGVLRVGNLLAVGQWQRAFFDYRHSFPRGGGDGGGLLDDGVPTSIALYTIVDSMLQNNQIHDLLSLPFSKEEEQEVISYLFDSAEGHVLILLLLRRRHIERAMAAYQLMAKDFSPSEPLSKDLDRILRNYEPFLPEEEVRALKGDDPESRQLCHLVANLESLVNRVEAAESTKRTQQQRPASSPSRRAKVPFSLPSPPKSSQPAPFAEAYSRRPTR